jgi:hypothetical protein
LRSSRRRLLELITSAERPTPPDSPPHAGVLAHEQLLLPD